jgi:peptidoglycan/xylan/chitin deacetylase (PgdA/CDA1 family)
MKRLRSTVIRTGLEAFYLTGAYRLMRPFFAGVGAIFMLHHVRPRSDSAFQPNHHLEVDPSFLRATLAYLRACDVDIITIDELYRRLAARDFSRRFACFTFDDGYRDNRDHALPVLREFDAPCTVYAVSDFAAGTGRLWWVALERAVTNATTVEVTMRGEPVRLDARTPDEKQDAFARLHDWLRALPNEYDIAREISALCVRHGVDETAIARELCMSWDELKAFAADPLVTIGAHTITHSNLAKQSEEAALRELVTSRADLEAALGRPVVHLAYPYGDRFAAGPREFALARTAGFKTAVTTRPGMTYTASADHLTALQRVSLNGNFQDLRILPVLTSGAATALWNRFRRIDAA